MTELRFTRLMKEHAPDPSPQFARAMEQTLERIAREEEHPPRRRLTRRQLAAAVVAALLILSVAMAAALGRNVIDFFTMGNVTDSQRMIQKNLAHASFAHCDITVREAAYDGMSLYILYAVQDRDATEPLGLPNPRTGERYMQEPYTPGMQADNVSWWIDGLWINGSEIDVPNLSVWNEFGTDTPGEMLCYQLWRLDQLGVYLNGQVEITLPLGERQSRQDLPRDERGWTRPPEEGVITFTLDTSIRDDVFVEQPGIRSEIEGVTLWVSEAVYTPVQVYLTVDYTVPQALMDAYVEEQGGQPEEEWLQYTPMHLVPWMSQLSLVDGEGNSLYTLSYIGQCYSGTSDSQAWFTFPAISAVPPELYLALYDDETGTYDLSRSVRVR